MPEDVISEHCPTIIVLPCCYQGSSDSTTLVTEKHMGFPLPESSK